MGTKDIIEKAIKEARENGRGKIISRDDIYNAIFKAGYDERNKWLSSHEVEQLEDTHKAGIMKVVEWLEQQDDVMTFINMHCEEKYEAQKKIWLK